MTARRIWVTAVFLAIAAALLAANCLFVVDEGAQAIVLRFGHPLRVINAPGRDEAGLQVKAPWETVVKIEKREVALDADPVEVAAADQQKLVIDPFLRFRIVDPLAFYETFRDDQTERDRLNRLVSASTRQALAQASSADIISGRQNALMAQATALAAAEAKTEKLGLEVIDVRVRRVSLPDANAQAVYQRMKSVLDLTATQTRAVGDQRKRDVMAAADQQVAAINAQADADAARIRAEGDAQRAQIFAQSFGRDPEFASFYRAMQVYDATLAKDGVTFVLSPDSAFLKYMKAGPAGR